jgi:hypothetical protein
MQQHSYQDLLETSQQVNWRIDDIIGGDKRLDFSKPFLPETFARTEELAFLKLHAVKTLAGALADEPQAFWDADVFRMTVSDPDGLALFAIEMFSTMAPAGGRRS